MKQCLSGQIFGKLSPPVTSSLGIPPPWQENCQYCSVKEDTNTLLKSRSALHNSGCILYSQWVINKRVSKKYQSWSLDGGFNREINAQSMKFFTSTLTDYSNCAKLTQLMSSLRLQRALHLYKRAWQSFVRYHIHLLQALVMPPRLQCDPHYIASANRI